MDTKWGEVAATYRRQGIATYVASRPVIQTSSKSEDVVLDDGGTQTGSNEVIYSPRDVVEAKDLI